MHVVADRGDVPALSAVSIEVLPKKNVKHILSFLPFKCLQNTVCVNHKWKILTLNVAKTFFSVEAIRFLASTVLRSSDVQNMLYNLDEAISNTTNLNEVIKGVVSLIDRMEIPKSEVEAIRRPIEPRVQVNKFIRIVWRFFNLCPIYAEVRMAYLLKPLQKWQVYENAPRELGRKGYFLSALKVTCEIPDRRIRNARLGALIKEVKFLSFRAQIRFLVRLPPKLGMEFFSSWFNPQASINLTDLIFSLKLAETSIKNLKLQKNVISHLLQDRMGDCAENCDNKLWIDLIRVVNSLSLLTRIDYSRVMMRLYRYLARSENEVVCFNIMLNNLTNRKLKVDFFSLLMVCIADWNEFAKEEVRIEKRFIGQTADSIKEYEHSLFIDQEILSTFDHAFLKLSKANSPSLEYKFSLISRMQGPLAAKRAIAFLNENANKEIAPYVFKIADKDAREACLKVLMAKVKFSTFGAQIKFLIQLPTELAINYFSEYFSHKTPITLPELISSLKWVEQRAEDPSLKRLLIKYMIENRIADCAENSDKRLWIQLIHLINNLRIRLRSRTGASLINYCSALMCVCKVLLRSEKAVDCFNLILSNISNRKLKVQFFSTLVASVYVWNEFLPEEQLYLIDFVCQMSVEIKNLERSSTINQDIRKALDLTFLTLSRGAATDESFSFIRACIQNPRIQDEVCERPREFIAPTLEPRKQGIGYLKNIFFGFPATSESELQKKGLSLLEEIFNLSDQRTKPKTHE